MKKLLNTVVLCLWLVSRCSQYANENVNPLPTPIATPSTVSEVLKYMDSNAAEERIVGMWAAVKYPDEDNLTLPLIVRNLYYEPNSQVRENSASVLGVFGPRAEDAVQDLIAVLRTDNSVNVQIESARALGPIGKPSAVPALATNLYAANNELAIFAAKSIGLITNQAFPDSDSTAGYRLNEEGIPLIVLAAREWWEKIGQFEDW